MNAPSIPTAGSPQPKRPRQKAAPEGSREALRLAACVLEVLAGMRGPMEAAAALGVSVTRYYQLEQRALEGLVHGCEPVRRGRSTSGIGEVCRLRHENERLARECQRQQALVRLARQAAGLTAPAEASPSGSKKRRRKKARGQQAAEQLQRAAATTSSAGPAEEASSSPTEP